MRWFNRSKPREIWDEPVQGGLGDIEAAQRIREICRAAGDSAERSISSGKMKEKRRKRDRDRYERAARAAMEIAMKMSDDLMRDASVGEIVRFCMKANDEKTARPLLRAIGDVSIRSVVLDEHPALRE